LTIVAFVIAAPLAWFVMFQVLNSIPYRTNIPVWLIAMIGAFILLIATLTVGFQAIKAATANPVNAIKTE
jgi:ABC-type antimicrobial peptide transport system permease subunit